MQPHQQRVVDEKDELSDKLNKLNVFIGGTIYMEAFPKTSAPMPWLDRPQA